MRTTAILASIALAAPALAQFGGPGGVTKLWNTTCASCHGEDGGGKDAKAKSLLKADLFLPAFDRPFFDAIKNGMPDAPKDAQTHAFGKTLQDEQVWSLVVHLREMQHKERRKRLGSPTPEKAKADAVFKTQHHSFRVETVIDSGLKTPWAVEFLPTNDKKAAPAMLVTEKPGDARAEKPTGLRVFENGKLSPPIAGLPSVYSKGQGGLMDVAVHPDYSNTGWVYLSYSSQAEGGRGSASTHIIRGKLAKGPKGEWAWSNQETIYQPDPKLYSSGGLHFGSRIVFDPPGKDGKRQGLLFFCIGEHGNQDHAQDLARQNGKVHRVNDDGSIPKDNPFVSVPGALPTIWSYGHRNPQGLVFDLDGNLWDTEHAPRGGDELNLIQKAANYGWPLVSFGINYADMPFETPWPELSVDANSDKAKDWSGKPKVLTAPVHRWIPSIAVCGLAVVAPGSMGEAFPKWKGDLIAGGLAMETVRRVRIREGKVVEEEEIFHGRGRVRDITVGPEGAVYITLNAEGKNKKDSVVKLVPAE